MRAETIADALREGSKPYLTMTQLDFDADGRDEIEITSPQFAAVVKPSDGGTLEVLDFRPSAVTLINSLQRRVEAYHSRLQHANQPGDGAVSIHNQTLAKEAGLEKHLKYDRWARNTFRLLLFAKSKTHADFEALRLDESAVFAGGDYRIEHTKPREIKLTVQAPLCEVIPGTNSGITLSAAKTLKFDTHKNSFDVTCRMDLLLSSAVLRTAPPVQFAMGLEMVLNMLAPNAPDRYFEFSGTRQPLEWTGVVEGSRMRVVDKWQDVAVGIDAEGAGNLWVAPIETVSESEEGFERVYQGSQILGLWPVEFSSSEKWSSETVLHVTTVRKDR